jgi:hypothetical protein
MAIKQRKQLTGTTAQINAYAGVEGQLVWDKTKKKWVGMSGTAGTNYPMASESHTHSISNVTDLQTALDGKQPKGDYATSKALTDGLAGKANSSHTHTKDQITDFPTIPDAILKKGNRGAIAGYEQWTKAGATTTLNVSSGDSLLMETAGAAATINVQVGPIDQVATKLVWVSLSDKSITINGITGWFGEAAPTLNKSNTVLLFFFHDGYVECRLIGHWD